MLRLKYWYQKSRKRKQKYRISVKHWRGKLEIFDTFDTSIIASCTLRNLKVLFIHFSIREKLVVKNISGIETVSLLTLDIFI
jgi:hypothetical protein